MSITIIECDMCGFHRKLLITIRPYTARSTDKHFCSLECVKEFCKMSKNEKIMKRFDVICDDPNVVDELMKSL